MYSFLVVEDIESTLAELQTLLSEVFPNSRVDVAETTVQALDYVEAAARSKRPYHAAVVDFMLPHTAGERAEIDECICRSIRTMLPGTLIVHITAYAGDPIVLAHFRDVDLVNPGIPSAVTISKLEVDWASQLLSKLKQYLYGMQIEEQMDGLFRADWGSTTSTRGRVGRDRVFRNGDVTHALANLDRDIVTHWDDLDNQLQARIQSVFHVDTSGRPIRISLL